MFHLSGGCCDGSAPMCFQVGEFKLGGVDEKVGEIAGCEFWMDREQFKRWAHTQWVVDVVPGRGASFSLEAPLNKRFLIRSSLCAVRPADQSRAPRDGMRAGAGMAAGGAPRHGARAALQRAAALLGRHVAPLVTLLGRHIAPGVAQRLLLRRGHLPEAC